MALHSFSASDPSVETYGRFEITITGSPSQSVHPFLDVRVAAVVTTPSGAQLELDGFCDSEDGSCYRVRIMPTETGEHSVAVTVHICGADPMSWETTFTAHAGAHPGIVRLDPDHPRHFLYSESGEHYYWNGTTAYYLMGWKEEGQIIAVLDRLSRKGVNRIRVLIYGREYENPWGTPVKRSSEFSLCLNPWMARFPDDVTNPDFDLTRFNIAYWQRFERMLLAADARGMQASVCFFIGGQPLAVPFAMWSEDEYRYYRYAVARLAAFPNLMWDLGNEHDFHRDNVFWVNLMGTEVYRRDPYRHLMGVHNRAYHESWGTWLTIQLHQSWDAGVSDVLAEHDEKQEQAGRIVPQVLEEYGYEDLWEQFPGHRSAETRRRVCWEVAMAGFYQTNGETPAGGTGSDSDTGGGWVNGRGVERATMFDRVRVIRELFEQLEWWRLRPDPDAVIEYHPSNPEQVEYFYQDGRVASDRPVQVLSDEVGKPVLIYLPYGGTARIRSRVPFGDARVTVVRPVDGGEAELGTLSGTVFQSAWEPGPADVLYVIRTQ